MTQPRVTTICSKVVYGGISLLGLMLAGCTEQANRGDYVTFEESQAQEAQETADKSDRDAASADQPNEPSTAERFAEADPASAVRPANLDEPLPVADAPRSDETPEVAAAGNGPGGTRQVAEAESDEAAEPRVPKLLIPERKFEAEGPRGALRVSYDDLDLLKVLNMDPVTEEAKRLMPSWLRELDGKTIRVRGFMYPTFIESGITQFVLARDNQICCFGRNPKVYDLIEVQLRDGETTRYIEGRPFDVVGTFHIDLQMSDGEPFGLYFLTDAQLIE